MIDEDLTAIETRCEQMVALSARVRRAGATNTPHVTPGALSLWLDELCVKDIPELVAKVRRLREEVAYLRLLHRRGGESETAFLQAALRRIADATWEVWRADAAARSMVQEARWALGEQD